MVISNITFKNLGSRVFFKKNDNMQFMSTKRSFGNGLFKHNSHSAWLAALEAENSVIKPFSIYRQHIMPHINNRASTQQVSLVFSPLLMI